MTYMVMNFDIVDSRHMEKRQDFQYRLIDILEEANKKFHKELLGDFMITLGDEWQGLLQYPCHYQSIIDYFQDALAPIHFYCGIGVGELSIQDLSLTVNQLDGPAFHLARKAVESAKDGHIPVVIMD